jgi:L-fuconolactonase
MTMARAPRIDAHQHYWSVAHRDYGWLQPTPELRPIYRDFGPADLHPHLDAAGIDATVLVQAAPSEAETWRLLQLAAAPGSRVAGVVGWCDLLDADAPQRIAQLAAQPLLKGLRPMLQDLDDPRWILQRALQPALQAMVRHGLVFDALVKGAAQLDALCEFAAEHGALRIVLDHGAKPPLACGDLAAWRAGISRLARAPNVYCKLSGLVTEAGAGWRVAGLRDGVEHLLAEFGAPRLLWGSDWPVLNLAADYHAWWRASGELLGSLNAAQREQVFGRNAVQCYGLRLE